MAQESGNSIVVILSMSSKYFFESDHCVKWSIVGIDLTPEMLQKAARLPFEALSCQNIQEELPFSSSSFDAIICVGVLDFITDHSRVLNEMGRVLKCGGIVGLTIPESYCGDEVFQKLLGSMGFSILTSERFFGYVDSKLEKSIYFIGFLLKKKLIVKSQV